MSRADTQTNLTRKADADLSANQYRAVTATASNGCALAGANARALGVLQNKPKSGEAATVCVDGPTKAVAGAAIAVNDALKTDATGRLVAAGGEAAGVIVEIVAHAVEAASAAGDIVEVLLRSYTINRATT